MPNNRVILDLHGTLDGPPGAPFFIIKRKNRRFTNRKGTIKIQAFQIPISNAGMADMIHLLFTTFGGQHVRYKLIIVLGALFSKTFTLGASLDITI